MASDAELFNVFMSMAPPAVLAKQGSPEFGDLFNRWAGEVAKEFGVNDWSEIPTDQLDTLEWNTDFTTGSSTTGPAEQQIFNQIAPVLTGQIQGDVARAAEADRLAAQTRTAYGNLGDVLGQATMRFDGASYLQANPDLAAEYERQRSQGMLPTDATGNPLTAEAWAKLHYDTYGKNEGRKGAGMTSDLLNQQRANVDTTVKTVIDASNTNAANANASLANLTADQISNLGKSLATQQGAITKLTGEQLTNLETSIATQKAALERQVMELQGSADQAAQARRTALTQQLAELTAAQRPVSDARIRAAENEVTGINLGLEGTRDQIAADAAREGFVGPSSFTDSALARSAIDARQGAARVAGNARVANAVDERGIGTYGANQGYSISDVFAGDRQRASDFGSGGRAALTSAGAQGTQAINDRGAGASTDLTGRGAEAERGISDAGATGRFNIATTASREAQGATTAGAGQKSTYFDSLFPAAVNSAQLLTGLPAAKAGALTSLIPYGTAGTNNALNTLSWWQNNATPPSTTAVMGTPSNQGNQIGQLGAGIAGAAFQAGQANRWWQPTPTPAPTTTAVTTTNRSTATSPQQSTWPTWGGGSNNRTW